MIQLNVSADISRVQRFYSNLRKSAVPKAAARAINDTLVTLRAEGSRAIKRQHPALRIGDVKSRMTMKRAYYLNLRGMVATQGRPMSALLFRPTGGTRRFSFRKTGTAGVYNVTRAARPSAVKIMFGRRRGEVSIDGRKGFRVPGYGNEVFVRRFGKGRQLRRFRGPSMPGVFRAQGQYMKSLAEQRWRTTFNSRMQYEIERAKK